MVFLASKLLLNLKSLARQLFDWRVVGLERRFQFLEKDGSGIGGSESCERIGRHGTDKLIRIIHRRQQVCLTLRVVPTHGPQGQYRLPANPGHWVLNCLQQQLAGRLGLLG